MLKSYGTEAIILYFLAFFGGAAINRFGSSLVSLVDPSVSSASGFMDFGIVVFGFFLFIFSIPFLIPLKLGQAWAETPLLIILIIYVAIPFLMVSLFLLMTLTGFLIQAPLWILWLIIVTAFRNRANLAVIDRKAPEPLS